MFGSFISGRLYEEDKDGGQGGGGEGGKKEFDADAFERRMLDNMNKAINGLAAKLKQPKENGGSGNESDAERQAREEHEREEAAKGGDKPDPKFLKLQKDFEKLTKQLGDEKNERANTEAKAKDEKRKSEIKTKLSEFAFVKPKTGPDAAFKALQGDISFDDEGNLVGPGGEPFSDYIDAQMNDALDTLLAPKEKGGSGAQRGAGRGGNKGVDLNDLKAGANKETLEAARKEIYALLGQRL